jgi:hypothetical protein
MREAVDIAEADTARADLHQGKISYSLFVRYETSIRRPITGKPAAPPHFGDSAKVA